MRATISLLIGVLIGAWLGWIGVGCVTVSTPAAAANSQMRSYSGSCDQTDFSFEELRELVAAELGYSSGDSPRQALVVFRREGERANLELVEDGHFDDSVSGESRFFELHFEKDGWRVVSCARDLRCYRGKSEGLCN